MPVFGNILAGASGQGGGYTIDQSIRFNDNDSAYLYRTFGTPTDRNKWSYSLWMKPTTVTAGKVLETNVTGGVTFSGLAFGNNMAFFDYSGGSAQIDVRTAFNSGAFFRDPSSWYHVLFVYDSDQATNTERVRFYINGTRFPSSSLVGVGGGAPTWPAQFADSDFNANGIVHRISSTINGLVDGYLAEIYFIDGQALDPTSFGEFNADTGQWVPIDASGSLTFGTNGFYITGENSADLGADYSGNGNNFTSSGLTSADQRTDTPTNNHCTFNPLWIDTYTLSDGNLVTSTGADASALGTMAVDATDSDGWYWEMKVTTAATYPGVGIILASQTSLVANTALSNLFTNRYYYEGWSGNFNNQGSAGAYGNTWSGTANKVIGVYLKGGALWFSIDGVVQNSGDPSTASTGAAITGLTGDFYPVVVYAAGSGTQAAWTAQFAESDWGTTPPAGYKAINTANLSDPAIANPYNHFNTVLYEGNGGGQRVGQFQPITESYNVDNSCMFDDASPDWMNRTNGTPDDNDVWTLSFWVKFAEWGSDFILQGYTDGNNNEGLSLNGTGGTLAYKFQIGGVDYGRFESAEIFKDPSRWYHIHITRNAGTYTFKADGVDLTDTDSGGSAVTTQNAFFNTSGTALYIGAANGGVASTGLNGYLAEMHFIDGSVVAYTNFGQLDASTNRWIPKEYTSGWGSNGWYLDFSNSSSLGADSSGNGNNFSVNNIVAANQVTDSPTKNFATLSPLVKGSEVTLTDGNLVADCGSGSTQTRAFCTIGLPETGKWTFQIEAVSSTLAGTASISSIGLLSSPSGGDITSGLKIGQSTANENAGLDFYNGFTKKDNASQLTAAQLRDAGDKGIVAYDADTKELWLGYAQSVDSSWTWVGGGDPAAGTSPTYTMSYGNQYFAISTDRSKTIVRFGSTGDGLAPPTGFNYLNNDNLPLTGAGLSGFVWIKNRDAADNNMLFDAVRGATKDMHSNATDAEVTNVNTLQRFLLNGFEVGNDVEVNTVNESYVAWQWLYNSLTASSNTDGSITSSVLANTTAGFSIATYTGTGSAATIGHGLGVAPDFILVKKRVVGTDDAWIIWHQDLPGPNYYLNFDTGAQDTSVNYWNNTLPTSSVFSVGASNGTNQSTKTFVAYLWNEVEGFSKFGKYTGNGSADGPFIYCGFRPSWVMFKRTDNTADWLIKDASGRDPYNVMTNRIYPNTTAGDDPNTTNNLIDFVSNGFKHRAGIGTGNYSMNASGSTYIYAAFAESPFQYSNAR